MFHQRITLPESHSDYPSVWRSECGSWRVIRCVDDIQYIVQQYRTPKWRSKSYHKEWRSIEKRWPYTIQSNDREPQGFPLFSKR